MVTINSCDEPTGASGTILQGQGVGTASTFSTATYPSVATGTGKILREDGTNWVATTATFPDTAGANTNVLTSNGTNWSSSAIPTITAFTTQSGTLTNAQIKALHATPIQIIAAPGAGKIISVIGGTGQMIYGGTNVFVAGAGQLVEFFYGTTQSAGQCVPNTGITSASTNLNAAAGGSSFGNATVFENVAINLYNQVATEITGNAANNNTITYTIMFQTVTI